MMPRRGWLARATRVEAVVPGKRVWIRSQ